MDNGFILLYRKLIDSAIFANEKALKIWIWCLLKASYKDRHIPINVGKGIVTVSIKAGQFIYGRSKVEELNIDKETVRYWLDKFEKNYNMIKINPTNQYSIITICNWEHYQYNNVLQSPTNHQPVTNQLPSNIQPITNQLPSNPQVTTTNNKVNNPENVNKVYKEEKGSDPTPTVLKKQFLEFVFLTDNEHQKLVTQYGEQDTQKMIEKLNAYKGTYGKKTKSDFHAIGYWVKEWLKEEKDKESRAAKIGEKQPQIPPQIPKVEPDYSKTSFY